MPLSRDVLPVILTPLGSVFGGFRLLGPADLDGSTLAGFALLGVGAGDRERERASEGAVRFELRLRVKRGVRETVSGTFVYIPGIFLRGGSLAILLLCLVCK